MFKKLKAKIEEGGDGGIENISFSPRRTPGTAVRSQSIETSGGSCRGESAQVSRSPSPTQESRDEDQDEGVTVSPVPRNHSQVPSDEFPAHITMKPSSSYDAILEARISKLEQECLSLEGQLTRTKGDRDEQVSSLRGQLDKTDSQRTELKLQVLELQLEKSELANQLEESTKVWTQRLKEAETERQREKKDLEERLATLQKSFKESEDEVIRQENVCCDLQQKNAHLKSQIEAFQESSANEVVSCLQSEVADLERVIQSRNLDIQIMERRIANQAKGSQDEYGAVIDRHYSLESSYKELSTQLDQRRVENRKLVQELEREQRRVSAKEREIGALETQLQEQETKHKILINKLDLMRAQHDQQIQEVDCLVQEKDERISELLCNLKQLRGGDDSQTHLPDGSILASVGGLRPPGMARRTASVGVQTSEEIYCHDFPSDPAVLPVDDSMHTTYPPSNTNGERATMNSLGPGDELVLLREEQLKLEEDMAEKNKIIKVQQQKILDMKKALTKELQRSASTQDLSDSFRGSKNHRHTPSPPPSRISEDINFQYLKYVVLKFVSSPQDECLQLVRAVSTLLEFSPQEEKYVKDYLDYKMSWFGSLPPPLNPSLVKK